MRRVFKETAQIRRFLAGGTVSDEQWSEMQYAIMSGQGATVRDTGGLKKIRCAAESQGKRGGVRVVFADYPDKGVTFLLFAFGKNVKESLTAADRKGLRRLKQTIDEEMRQ